MTDLRTGQTVQGASTKTRYQLGEFIARGGEGEVFLIRGSNNLVAKIYTRSNNAAQYEKLSVLVKMKKSQLTKIAAWPEEIVVDDNRQPVGFVMPWIEAGRPLHTVLSPSDRLRAMPTATFASLVTIAINLARAVATFHQAKVVIGDINSSNFLVLRDGTVRIIDCDSVQIGWRKKFRTQVAMEEYTAPELQGVSVRRTRRTANHDNFGLAVLIFELLLLGRHPFSGNGDMPLGRSIKRRRHALAFAEPRHSVFKVLKIKRTALLSRLLIKLFARAFGKTWPFRSRPTAIEWMDALIAFQSELNSCKSYKSHVYASTARQCPWCALEAQGRPPMFVSERRQESKKSAGWLGWMFRFAGASN